MKVLIAGYGSTGQYVVDFLLKDHRINNLDAIHIMSRKTNHEVGPRLTISKIAAGISKRYIPLIYHCCDFNNIVSMSNILSSVRPDVVVYTGRYASGLKYGAFSYPHDIGYGVWMPMSLPYIRNLMIAVKDSGIDTKVVNTSFPDGVNYLLDQEGLSPYCGAGNINHLIPRIKYASDSWGDPKYTYDINFVCSHYVNTYVSKEGTDRGAPSLLRIRLHDEKGHDLFLINDKNLQDQDSFKNHLFDYCRDNSAGGQIRNQMIATDCAEIVRILLGRESLDPSEGQIHLPGYKGLPGGFRVNLVSDTIDSCWSISEVCKVGEEGLRRDGVFIKDKKLHFTQINRDKMKEIYHIDYPENISVCDIQKFADEISSKLKEVAASWSTK